MDVKYTRTLLNALLRRRENSEDTVEELNSYVTDLQNGDLSDADARYIQALAKRLGVVPRSGTTGDSANNEPEALGLEGHEREVAKGSFLERARTLARATMEKYRPPGETDHQTVLDRLSDQLDALAARLEEDVLRDAKGEGALPVPTGRLRTTLMRDPQTPALFMDGNERELHTTPGFIRLAAMCDDLALRLKVETGHEEGYAEPKKPNLYHVDLVISGWV